MNGLTLQLVSWQPFFEPTFTKLTKAMVWLQLHNLPMELWNGDSLETLTEPIGRHLKVDELTMTLARAKYMRVCLEIDLAQPLTRSFWVKDGKTMIFVMILYKHLPTFRFHCGLVGNGANNCSLRLEQDVEEC